MEAAVRKPVEGKAIQTLPVQCRDETDSPVGIAAEFGRRLAGDPQADAESLNPESCAHRTAYPVHLIDQRVDGLAGQDVIAVAE